MRCWWRIFSASSSVVPTGTVIRFARVIRSSTRKSVRLSKRRSRLVRIPTSLPFSVTGTPVGILTNRDLRFERRTDLRVEERMTRANLITVPVGTTLDEAEKILHQHRIEKLPVVDENYMLKGLITVKDIQKRIEYPRAAKDAQGRLRVGAAVGVTGDYLERAQ